MTKLLTTPIEWAIKEEARILMSDLEQMVLDRDLAFAVVENHLPENRVYNLPTDEDEDTTT